MTETTRPAAEPDDRPAPEPRGDRGPGLDRIGVVLVGVAVAVGVVLRFWPRSALWLDEALTISISTLPIGEIGDALRRDGHPPLYYVLMHLWTALGGESDWWVRALSGVISVAGLPLAYLAGRRIALRRGGDALGARRTGMMALAVMAILPYGIRYGAEARMYSLVITLVVGGYLLVDDLLLARRQGRERALVAAGAALVVAALLWTHYWSMWLLGVVGLLALWQSWRSPDPERRVGARWLAGSLVAGGVLFLPWVPTLLFQAERTGTPWGVTFGPIEVLTVSVVALSGDDLLAYVVVVLVALAAAGVVTRRPGERTTVEVVELGAPNQPRVRVELVIAALTLVVGWATATISSNTYSPRYAAVVFPLLVLAVAAGIAVLRHPRAVHAVLAVLVVLASWTAFGSARTDRTDAGSVATQITADHSEVDGPAAIVVCPDQIGVALQRALAQRSAAAGLTTPDVIPFPAAGDPRFIDWVDYAERNGAADVPGFLEEISDRVPEDATVYLVATAGYETFDTRCEELVGALSAQRPLRSQVEPSDDGEQMGLWIYDRPA